MAASGGNISQRIALEGAQEILKSLSDIGVRGQAAFKQLSDAVQATQPQLSGFEAAINRAGTSLQKFASFSFSDVGKNFSDNFKIGHSFDQLEEAAGRVITRFAAVGAGITGVAAALALFVKSSANSASEAKDNADALGLSIEAYQALQFAAAASGVEQDKFTTALKNLSKNVAEAAKAQGEGLDAFQARFGVTSVKALQNFALIGDGADGARDKLTAVGVRAVGVGEQFESLRQRMVNLGVRFADLNQNIIGDNKGLSEGGKAILALVNNLKDADGKTKPLEDTLGALADKFQALGKGPEATALALKIFGREGNALLPLLLKGRSGVDELTASFKALGVGLTEADAKVAESNNIAFTKLTFTLSGVKTALGLVFAPSLTVLIDSITATILKNQNALREWAANIAAKVTPVVAGFVKALTGLDVAGTLKLSPDQIIKADEWAASFRRIGEQIGNFFTSVTGFFTEKLPAAFEFVRPLLEKLAAGFEKLTGIKLSPEEMGILLIGTQITGVNSLVLNLITTFGLLTIAGLAALGPAGWITLGLIALGGLVLIAKNATEEWRKFQEVRDAAMRSNPSTPLAESNPAGSILGKDDRSLLSKRLKQEAADTEKAWREAGNKVLNDWKTVAESTGNEFEKQVSAPADALPGKFTAADAAAAKLKATLDGAGKSIQVLSASATIFSDKLGGIKVVNADDTILKDRPKTQTAADQLVAPVTGADQKIRELLAALSEFVQTKFAGFAKTVSDGIAAAFGGLSDQVSTTADKVKSAVDKIVATAERAVTSLRQLQGASSRVGEGVDLGGDKVAADTQKALQDRPKTQTAADQLVAPIAGADQKIRELLAALSEFVQTKFADFGKTVNDAVAAAFGGLADQVASAADKVNSAVERIVATAERALTSLRDLKNASSALGNGGDLGGDKVAADTQRAGLKDSATPQTTAAAQLLAAITEADQKVRALLTALNSFVAEQFASLAQAVAEGLSAAFKNLSDAIEGVASSVDGTVSRIVESVQRALDSLRQLKDARSADNIGGGSGGDGGPPFARGGSVFGPGTSTSDSIFARLSHGEFVMRAAAVQKYGTGLMYAINNLRLPKFSVGGLADQIQLSFADMMAVPRFAQGGLALPAMAAASSGATRTSTFVLDGQKFGPFTAPADVVGALERHSIFSQAAATGKYKPRWVR